MRSIESPMIKGMKGIKEMNENAKAMQGLIALIADRRNYLTSWDDPETCACDLLTARILDIDAADDGADEDITEWPEWGEVEKLIKASLDHPYGFDTIIDGAAAAFNDPTESFHAAHIRDAIRDNWG